MPPIIFPTDKVGACSKVALMPTENSGKVVTTPNKTPRVNNFMRSAKAMLRICFTAKSAVKPNIPNKTSNKTRFSAIDIYD